MTKALVCWIGRADTEAAAGDPKVGLGPVAQALHEREYDLLLALSNYGAEKTAAYVTWLSSRTKTRVETRDATLPSPTDYGAIYRQALAAVEDLLKRSGKGLELTFHVSPGTPAMAAVWIILAKTRFGAGLIKSSPERGVEDADVPFELSAEYLPDAERRRAEELAQLVEATVPEAPEFADIVHRCQEMRALIKRAQKVARYPVNVLLEGPSGTGKELFAKAIHSHGGRGKPFVAVNCGAIPESLVEAELFGYRKGAFSGADRDRKGHFHAADGGTLFLDEVGELPLAAQVKLLRVLQQRQVTRLGASEPEPIEVRVIAATHRNLLAMVAEGRFREDLYYRLGVAILKVPPLRERKGDLGLLVDHILRKANERWGSDPALGEKKLSPAAKNLLLHHPWPGNVRELENTLQRAIIWSEGATISGDDMRAVLPTHPAAESDGALGLPLGDGFKIEQVLARVARHYLERALEEAGDNRTHAAALVGLKSRQTFNNWLKQFGAEV